MKNTAQRATPERTGAIATIRPSLVAQCAAPKARKR
jgi:hypothetical protein